MGWRVVRAEILLKSDFALVKREDAIQRAVTDPTAKISKERRGGAKCMCILSEIITGRGTEDGLSQCDRIILVADNGANSRSIRTGLSGHEIERKQGTIHKFSKNSS